METELTEHVEMQDKKVRRKNREMKSGETDEEVVSLQKPVQVQNRQIQIIKEVRNPAPTPLSLLNDCIQAKTAMIVIAQRMGRENDVEALNEEVYDLLKKKSDLAFAEFEKSQSK